MASPGSDHETSRAAPTVVLKSPGKSWVRLPCSPDPEMWALPKGKGNRCLYNTCLRAILFLGGSRSLTWMPNKWTYRRPASDLHRQRWASHSVLQASVSPSVKPAAPYPAGTKCPLGSLKRCMTLRPLAHRVPAGWRYSYLFRTSQ